MNKFLPLAFLIMFIVLGCGTKNGLFCTLNLKPFQNPDGTKNIYLADSMKFDMNAYKIIRSYKRGHAFVIPNEVWRKGRFSEKRLLNDPSCYILDCELKSSFKELYNYPRTDSVAHKITGDEMGSALCWNRNYPKRKSYFVCYYPSGPPMYYYLFLVRGDAIIFMKTDDGINSRRYVPFKFIDDKCYYKVLRPVWNGVEWERTNPLDRLIERKRSE